MTEEKLWAVHAQGPDCLYPAKSIESAEKMAGEMNDLSKKARAQHGSDLSLAHAIVIPSPWSEVEHWKALAEQEESFCEEARQGWSACVKQLARAQALHKPALDLSWAAQGDANVYSIIKGGNWLAQVRLNGELLVAEQEDWMRRFTAQQPAGQSDHVEQALNMAQEALAASPAQEVQTFKEDPRSAQELSLAGCNCIRFGEGNPHWPCRLHPRASARWAEQQGSLSQAARDVLAERRRQIEAEGMTTAGDDGYHAAELPRAAAAYILNGGNEEAPCIWPWTKAWWKPRDARSNYVRAGALILAEIERLDRAALSAQQSAPVTEEPSPLDVIGYASPGQIEILRELPRTGGMKVKGRKDDRYSEPVVLLSEARAAMLSLVVRCQQEGAFKTCIECGYQDGHDEICQFHASNRNPQQSAHVSVPSGGRSIFAMILQALDRDAAEGKEARGEMAAELRTLLNGGEA